VRKFFLISALVLASVSAQAGQPRSLILASNDTPGSGERIESVQPDQPKADPQPVAAKPVTETAKPIAEVSRPAEASKPAEVSKPVRKASAPARKARTEDYASDEAKARSIAARYGISW
jgi:hypothetical protein